MKMITDGLEEILMKGVNEYSEGSPVYYASAYYKFDSESFEVIKGHRPIILVIHDNDTSMKIDLLNLIKWIKENKPELL